MTFTQEQLIGQAREEVDFWRERDELIPSQQSAIRLRLAEITLAALESRANAEPVAYMIGGHYLMHAKDPKVDNYTSAVPLYTRPQPAPVVQDCPKCGGTGMADSGGVQPWGEPIEIPCDCRAAMLQGKDEPVSQPYTLPEGYALVPVEPTIAMLDEFDSIIDYGADDSNDAWRRLLAAAWIKSLPAAPKQEAQEVKK